MEPVGPAVSQALEYLVSTLPPKERACVLLKDVFDYSLEEIAELVDSTVGGVKAALNRGRSKLESLSDRRIVQPPATAETSSLLRRYVDGFNRRDWDELRKLIGADARLQVADRFAGRLADSPYFARYERKPMPWRVSLGQLDGEAVILSLQKGPTGWEPNAVIRLHVVEDLAEQRIAGITDYSHCPWVLAAAASVTLSE
jgi:RNA polymerase sigma-70 factor (ECF subfamily)